MDDIYGKIADDTEFGIDFDGKSDIQNFFTDQTVFLTGGTGFLGKCFVEKLLRTCPDIRKLYILVRPRGSSVDERISKYFQNVIFDNLRKSSPNFESKVKTIEGNLMMESMELSETDRNLIINEVTMIVHAASNVKFLSSVSKLLRTNVLGTQYMLNLAKDVKNLNIFVYMSTAYSHCYQQHIDDVCYPSPADFKMVLDFIDVDEKTPGGINETARQEIQNPWPNMYVYSKAVAESLIEDVAKHAPFRCVIYRPSIVLPAYREPLRGWIDNANGPAMLVIVWALGLLHISYKGDLTGDGIPADMCTNALFALMWDAVVNRKEQKTVLVYNYGSSTVNQTSLLASIKWVLPRSLELPSRMKILPCWKIKTNYEPVFWFLNYLFHLVPAILLDVGLLVIRRKTLGMKLYKKLRPNASWIIYFLNGNWRIHVREMVKVWDSMSIADKHLFYSDMRTLSWEDHGYYYWPGVKVYLLKEPITPDENAKILRRLAIVNVAFSALTTMLTIFALFYFRDFVSFLLLPFYNLHKLCCLIAGTL